MYIVHVHCVFPISKLHTCTCTLYMYMYIYVLRTQKQTPNRLTLLVSIHDAIPVQCTCIYMHGWMDAHNKTMVSKCRHTQHISHTVYTIYVYTCTVCTCTCINVHCTCVSMLMVHACINICVSIDMSGYWGCY